MRLFLDANLSPSLVDGLSNAGFEALHVGFVDLLTASDAAIVDYARANDLVVVTADSDFASDARDRGSGPTVRCSTSRRR